MPSSPAGDHMEEVLRAATSALNGDGLNGYALEDVLQDHPVLRGEAFHAPLVEVESQVPGLEITANALEVLRRRYLAKNREGEIVETPDEMFRRVAGNLAEGDRVEEPGHDIEPIDLSCDVGTRVDVAGEPLLREMIGDLVHDGGRTVHRRDDGDEVARPGASVRSEKALKRCPLGFR